MDFKKNDILRDFETQLLAIINNQQYIQSEKKEYHIK